MATLWFNGHIYTMRAEGEKVEAVVTDSGHISACGDLEELRQQEGIDRVVDLEGGTMLPGLTDSHMHLIGYGESFLRLDLSRAESKQEMLALVAGRAAALPASEWIIGEGWNENLWPDSSIPELTEIDKASGGRPLLLKRACRHMLLANSAAMREAGVGSNISTPPGGIVGRDPAGRPNGIFKDEAQNLLLSALPPVDKAYLAKALRAGIQSCWENGLVGCHTEDLSYYGSFENTYGAFADVIQKERMKFRAHLLVHHKVAEEWHTCGYSYLSGDSFLDFGAMKIFIDGALGGRTALLSHPYADDPAAAGLMIHSDEDLSTLIEMARRFNMPIATHAIGDLAFEKVLNAIEVCPPPEGTRDRLIHAQILRRDLIERARKLPLILDIQPRFLASDFPWVIERVGEERMDDNYAWKTLIDAGIICAGGSDAPIEPADPLLGIHAAVTRQIPGDESRTEYMPRQKLTVFEAVGLFTKGSAYAAMKESGHGLISPGYAADFTVLDQDIFTIPPDKLLATKANMTVVDDTIVYTRS